MILLSSSQQPCQEKPDSLIHPRLELCQFCIEGNWGVETEVVVKRVDEREIEEERKRDKNRRG